MIYDNSPTCSSTWPSRGNYYEAYLAPPEPLDVFPDEFRAFLRAFLRHALSCWPLATLARVPFGESASRSRAPREEGAWWIRPRPKEQGRAGQPSRVRKP